MATAEGAFEIAELDRKVASASEWAARAGASEADQLRAAAMSARRQWLDATKPYYVAYVTAQARASADYQNDLAAARRGASAQQAAADVVYASSTASAAQARAIGAAGSASGFAGREVILSNAYDLAYAQAEASLRSTYAKAEKAKAVALATAEKACQVTLVGLDPAATDYQTTVDTAQKAHAVKQAEAVRDWTSARAGADEGWSIGIALVDEAYSKGWAERTYDEAVAEAKRDGAYSVLVTQAGSVRDVAYAQAQAGLWNQATTLDNARQIRLATAEVAWRDEQYTAQVAVTTALASTSTTPWAAFQRDLALAQQSWWTTTGASYTASVANANLAATAYQTLVGSQYVSTATVLAGLDLNYAKAQAADRTTYAVAQAQADKDHETNVATARRAYLVHLAEAKGEEDRDLAEATYQTIVNPQFDALEAMAEIGEAYQNDWQAAKRAYWLAIAEAEGTQSVKLAEAEVRFAEDSAAHDQAWAVPRAAAEKAYTQTEATAYAGLSVITGALDTAYRRQAAQGQQAALAALTQTSATPWSALEAARAAAFSDWTGGTSGAADIRRTSVANAQAALEVREAAADAVYAEASARVADGNALAEAQTALVKARTEASTLMAQASNGTYTPTLPRADAVPAHDDIVDVLLPGTYAAPAAKFDATYEAFGLSDAPVTMPGYYGYGWNGYGWNGWWGYYGWWNASWWNGGYWYGWYGDGLTNDSVRPGTAEGEIQRQTQSLLSSVAASNPPAPSNNGDVIEGDGDSDGGLIGSSGSDEIAGSAGEDELPTSSPADMASSAIRSDEPDVRGFDYEEMFTIFLQRYGKEGEYQVAWAMKHGWTFAKREYGWLSLRDDWWLDEEKHVIAIGNTDWGGATYRSADNAADQLMEALRSVHGDVIAKERQRKESDLLMGEDYTRLSFFWRCYRFNTTWMLDSWVASWVKNGANAWEGETLLGAKLSGWDRTKLAALSTVEALLVAIPGAKVATAAGAGAMRVAGAGALLEGPAARAMAVDILGNFGERAAVRLATTRAGQGFLRAYAKLYQSKVNIAVWGEKVPYVTVTPEATAFAARSASEAKKLQELIATAEQLKNHGVRVVVQGEGVAAGELKLTFPGFAKNILAESKRLTQANTRAVQTAIEKGTVQAGTGGTVVLDGTRVGVSLQTFEQAFRTFQRVALKSRLASGATGSSGRIVFLYKTGMKVMSF